MDHPPQLSRPLSIDPLAATAGLARDCGTLLLHGQRSWAGRPARSLLLFAPRWVLRQRAGGPARWSGETPTPHPPQPDALSLLGHFGASRSTVRHTEGMWFPGLAGFLGYELGWRGWSPPRPAPPPFRLPSAWIGAYDCGLLFGGGRSPRLMVSSLGPWSPPPPSTPGTWSIHPESGPRPPAGVLPPWRRTLLARADWAQDLLEGAARRPEARLASGTRRREEGDSPTSLPDPELPDPGHHRRAFQRIRRHLLAGDIYQANLTGFATARTEVSPWEAFLHQARLNPVPFAAYLRTEEATLTSHSPELLLQTDGERAETAPIKGTVSDEHGDWNTLQSSGKDRAEHLMIVDLCRNDLGICARPGTVEVVSFMEELKLRGLVHLVSRIQAMVPRGRQAELLGALFPGGSITGAPKRRAMEIIAAVEAHQRGPYTGSIGMVDASGRQQWNLAIRTAVWQDGRVSFGCGGGIVVDSDPDREYEEAVLKARSFFATLSALADRAVTRHPAAAS